MIPLAWPTNFCSPRKKYRSSLAFHELLQSFGLESTWLCVLLVIYLDYHYAHQASFSYLIEDTRSFSNALRDEYSAEFPQPPLSPR